MQPKFLLQHCHWLWRCTSNWPLVTELRALHNERRISLYQEEFDFDFEPSITRVWTRYIRSMHQLRCCRDWLSHQLIDLLDIISIWFRNPSAIVSDHHSATASWQRLANHHLRKEIVCDCFRSDSTSDHFKWRVIPLTVDSRTTGVHVVSLPEL